MLEEEVEEHAEIMSANLVAPEDAVTSWVMGDPSRWEGGVVFPHQAIPSWPGKDEPQVRLLGSACGDSNDEAHPPPPGSHFAVPGLGHQGHVAEVPKSEVPTGLMQGQSVPLGCWLLQDPLLSLNTFQASHLSCPQAQGNSLCAMISRFRL